MAKEAEESELVEFSSSVESEDRELMDDSE
jgi:hypothetical protein